MRESGMANAKPPDYNSISTTKVAQIKETWELQMHLSKKEVN